MTVEPCLVIMRQKSSSLQSFPIAGTRGMVPRSQVYTVFGEVSTPFATVSFSKEAALESLEKHGYPQIIKPTVGSWGRMISKINDKDSAEGIIESREKMYPIYQIH
ncbi:hypothetical protein LCGC14_2265270, partial [marine sediment metagenome]